MNTTISQSETQNELADRLDERISEHMTNVVESTELYRLVSDPDTDAHIVAAVVRHTMLESFSFTPSLCRTTLRAIGNMPHDMPEAMKQAVLHVYEELGHSEMAMRTFTALGGDETWARQRRMTPASVAFCGTFDRLVDHVSGFTSIGVWYALESMTGTLTERAMTWLENKGIGIQQREFIDVHAVDDIAHRQSMRNLMSKLSSKYPEAADDISYAVEVLLSIYPVPIWTDVVERAKADYAAAQQRE